MVCKVVIKHSGYCAIFRISRSLTYYSIFRVFNIKFILSLEVKLFRESHCYFITCINRHIISKLDIFILYSKFLILSFTLRLVNNNFRIFYSDLCALFSDLRDGLFSFSGIIPLWISYKSCRSFLWAYRAILSISFSIIGKCKCSKCSYC